MRAPERFETERLILRRPSLDDAAAILARYASDPAVTRFMSWRRHERIESVRAFLEFSDAEWERWPGGPYLVDSREDGRLLGGSGLAFETPYRATTGYIFARDEWGKGFATETVQAIVAIARETGLIRLEAQCHAGHAASARVLDKCGFALEGMLRRHTVFPNLEPGSPCDVRQYGLVLK